MKIFMIQEWYEVWVDESTKILYVLFLCPDPSNPGGMLIIDQKKTIELSRDCLTIIQQCCGCQKMSILVLMAGWKLNKLARLC